MFSIEVITPESLRKLWFADTPPPHLGMVDAQHRAKPRLCCSPVPGGLSGAPVGRCRVSCQWHRVHPTHGARSGGRPPGSPPPGAEPVVLSQDGGHSGLHHFSPTPRCGQRVFTGEVTVFQDTGCNCRFCVKYSIRTYCLKLCFIFCRY